MADYSMTLKRPLKNRSVIFLTTQKIEIKLGQIIRGCITPDASYTLASVSFTNMVALFQILCCNYSL